MAETVIAASLSLDSTKAETSVKAFRTQLKEATNDLISIQQQFGETSEQATVAAKRVAELRDRMDDAKQIADAFNPDARFNALTKAVQGAVGGVTALTGAMALFGSESEDVQKAILKVQGALALSQGLSQIGELGKSFAVLKIIAIDAFSSIKAAIGSTGIGAILLVLGGIVAYWDDIKAAVGIASGEQLKFLETSKQQYELEKSKLDVLTSQNNIYKEQGKSQQQILDIQKKQAENVVFAARLQLAAAQQVANVAIKASKTGYGSIHDIFFGTDEAAVKREQDKQLAGYRKSLSDAQNALAGYHLEAIKDQNDFNQKIIDLNHSAAEAGITDQYALSQIKLKDAYDASVAQAKIEYTNATERNKVLAGLEDQFASQRLAMQKANDKKRSDARKQATFDAYTANIPDQEVVAELQLKFQLDKDQEQATYEISNLKARNEQIANLQTVYDAKLATMRLKSLQDFQNKYTQAIVAQQVAQEDADNANQKNAEDSAEAIYQNQKEKNQNLILLDRELGEMRLDSAGQQAAEQLAQLEEWYSKKLKLAGDNEAAIKDLTKEYERQKTLIAQDENAARLEIISGALSSISELVGQQTVAGKVLAIASATIDTYVGATKALAQGGVFGFIGAAAVIAAGLANVKKIIDVQIPAQGGASSGAGSSIGTSPSAPLQYTPPVQQTALPQQQINQIGNSADPVKAYVVESDMTDSQTRVRRLNRAARLGG